MKTKEGGEGREILNIHSFTARALGLTSLMKATTLHLRSLGSFAAIVITE